MSNVEHLLSSFAKFQETCWNVLIANFTKIWFSCLL